MSPRPLIVIVGPTGVGKTALAVRLAETCPIEVVNADSRQVYRGMDIGTGKPTADEQAAVRHHLLDVVDPDERYHAAHFRTDALAAIEDIEHRGRLPAVVGGTGLYVRALLKGLHPAPPADRELRAELEEFVALHGAPALHARLAAVAPDAARRLHPNDRVRIVRAIEVHTLSDARPLRPSENGVGDWQAAAAGWRLVMLGLFQNRAALQRRLAERAREMIRRGMMDEVKQLLAAGYDEALPSMGGIGYRQFCAVLRGRSTVDEALRLMIRDTTRYAKRQMTWFAREPDVCWIDIDQGGGVQGAGAMARRRIEQEGLTG